MRKCLSVLFLLLLTSSVFAYDNEYKEGEVIVIIDNSYASSAMTPYASYTYSEALDFMAESFAASNGLVSLGTFSEISSATGANIVHLKSVNKSTEELMSELSNNPQVKSVQPNYIRRPFGVSKAPDGDRAMSASSQNVLIPNDPHYENQWGMMNIGMQHVWEYSVGSENVCVAVIDTGIDYNHEDLNANMAKDSSGNYGKLFSYGQQSSDPMDTSGHGTHIAGIIGAVGNNSIGVAGINWKVKMLAVNVMKNEIAQDTDVMAGIDYVISEKRAGLNVRVVNLSLGGWSAPLPDDSPLGKAISSLSDAGIVCVMAVGNDVQDISSPGAKYKGQLVYPACFKFANTMSVGSIGSTNAKSSYSNYSGAWVNIAAPGESIYSSLPYAKYGAMTGTSMSAAFVTGAVAFLCSAFPNESATQIKERILRSARNVESNRGYWESGLLDVARAYGVNPTLLEDEPMTSVEIKGEKSILADDQLFLNHIKHPTNANGYFEYLWKTGNKSIVSINGVNNPSAEIKGVSDGSTTITLTVTQTLQDGTKTTKSNSVDITVKKESSSGSSGCNTGLFTIALLVLIFMRSAGYKT